MSTSSARLIGFLLLSQSLFVASTFGTWLPIFLVAFLSLLIVFARRRDSTGRPAGSTSVGRRWVRWIAGFLFFVAVIGITGAWRIGNQLGESINPFSVAVDILAHAALFCSWMIWSIRPHAGHSSLLPLGLIVLMLCVAAGGTSLSLAAQNTVALAACLGFAIASQIILGVARGTGGAVFVREPQSDGRSGWIGPLFSLITLSVLLMATSAIANATSRVLPALQQQLHDQLQATLNSMGETTYIGGTRYVRGSQLGEVRQHMLADPQGVTLRIHSGVAPGYLRGNVFDRFRRRRWFVAGGNTFPELKQIPSIRDRALQPSGVGSVELQEPTSRPLQRFWLTDPQRVSTVNLEIHNDPLKGPVTFLPLNTRWLEAHSRELVLTNHMIVKVGVDPTRPYVAGVGLDAPSEELDPLRREVLLDVPSNSAAEAGRLANQICGPQPTARLKASALSSFFQREFEYSMTKVDTPRGVDPITHFLQSRHAAHCEYFATATVLVLRRAGIPARYVTGYVSTEYSDEQLYWLARNRDAHAWAEAYDEATKTWFPVESTPGRIYQSVNFDSALQESESLFGASADDGGEADESWLSRAVGWLLSFRATDPLLLLFRIAQLPLFCVLAFLLWTRYLKPTSDAMDPIDQQSLRMLRRADRRLRRHALVRTPGETLYQFADRIDAHGADTERPLGEETRIRLADIARWYRDYANARYRGRLPEPLA